MKNSYYVSFLIVISLVFSCENETIEDQRDSINANQISYPALVAGEADFSTYVSVGASFTAGYSDGALFKAAQEQSFPSLLARKFAALGGGDFTQPLVGDNSGGLLVGTNQVAEYRLIFNGSGPQRLNEFLEGLGAPAPAITTNAANNLMSSFNNVGVPGLKSFHLQAAGYGSLNPYYGRFASSATSKVIDDAINKAPTFFTFSEIGGNDVLSYATSGGIGVDQTGNPDPSSYGINDITDPTVFNTIITGALTQLTSAGAKGVVANVPYVSSLPYFTTVPFNSISPLNPAIGPEIPTLNIELYKPLMDFFTAYGEPNRIKELSVETANPLLIIDETATDLSNEMTAAFTLTLGATKAEFYGSIYGKARQATAEDLIVLTASSVIGMEESDIPAPINVNGLTYPLQDQWVLTAHEQSLVKTATDAYNTHIQDVVTANGLALVDFKGILETASATGITSGDYSFNTALVTGGLVSLDGIHLTSRGYAVLANEMMKAIDKTYGTNFESSGNLYNPGDFPTNYSPQLP